MSALRLIDPDPANLLSGRVFTQRQKVWRSRPQRHYPRHAALEPFAPAIIGPMFDRAARAAGMPTSYEYLRYATGQTVRVNVANWHWLVLDCTAEGRGLYELWAWRWALSIPDAAAEIWTTITAQQVAA